LLKLMIRSGLVRHLPGMARRSEGAVDFLRYYSDRVLTAPRARDAEAAGLFDQPAPDVIDLTVSVPRGDGVPASVPRTTGERRGWPAPWGTPALRAVVAERLLADRQLAFSPTDEVLVTPGAGGAVHTILDAFVNRGDRVVLLDPSSPLYPTALRAHGAKVRWLYSWMENGRTRFKLDELDRALRGAKLLILNSPGNPGGGFIAAEDLEQLAWWAERRDVLIVSDETYGAFSYEGEWTSPGTLSRGRRRTLTVGGLSRSHALAALRVGWLAGHRHLVRPCQLSAALRMTLVPAICQQVALDALRQPGREVSELAARRRYAFERLHAMGLKPAWPAGGLFFWVPVWEYGVNGQVFAERLLNDRRVQVTPGEQCGPSGLGHVRISFAADDGRLREGLSRLAEFVRAREPAAVRRAA
jgi:aspartate/methionine/tyrosine aminotransferase